DKNHPVPVPVPCNTSIRLARFYELDELLNIGFGGLRRPSGESAVRMGTYAQYLASEFLEHFRGDERSGSVAAVEHYLRLPLPDGCGIDILDDRFDVVKPCHLVAANPAHFIPACKLGLVHGLL